MNDELRRRTLEVVRISASIRDAQRNGVCRLCGEEGAPRRTPDGKVDEFVLNFGREFAHRSCIEREKQADDNVIVVSTTNDVGNWYWSQWVMASEMADGESASGGGEKKPMRMPSRKWFERMTKVDDSCVSVGGLASRVADLESSVQAASEGVPWQQAVLNEAVGIIVDGGDWGRGNDMNHGKLGAAVIWAEKEINRLRSLVVGLQSERDRLQEDAAASARLMYSANSDCIDAQDERDALQARVVELERQIGQADVEDADTGYSLRLFVDGRRVLSHELGPTQAGAFLIAADHLAKYIRKEYKPITDATNGSVAELEAASGGENDGVVLKCDDCGKRFWFDDTSGGSHRMVQPDNAFGGEEWETYCPACDAKPATGGGEQPDAWGVVRDGNVESVTHRRFRGDADRVAEQWGETVVPLYRAPPQPCGWLKEEERACLEKMRDELKRLLLAMSLKTVIGQNTERDFIAIESILARSTPPEVDLPISLSPIDEELVRKALAAAGVEVKEVRRE